MVLLSALLVGAACSKSDEEETEAENTEEESEEANNAESTEDNSGEGHRTREPGSNTRVPPGSANSPERALQPAAVAIGETDDKDDENTELAAGQEQARGDSLERMVQQTLGAPQVDLPQLNTALAQEMIEHQEHLQELARGMEQGGGELNTALNQLAQELGQEGSELNTALAQLEEQLEQGQVDLGAIGRTVDPQLLALATEMTQHADSISEAAVVQADRLEAAIEANADRVEEAVENLAEQLEQNAESQRRLIEQVTAMRIARGGEVGPECLRLQSCCGELRAFPELAGIDNAGGALGSACEVASAAGIEATCQSIRVQTGALATQHGHELTENCR